MKKETNPKAKRNILWCNVLIVTALLLIVAVLMVVLRRNAPANVDANAPLLPLTATDALTGADRACDQHTGGSGDPRNHRGTGSGCRAGSHRRPRSHRHPRPVAGESIPRRHRR